MSNSGGRSKINKSNNKNGTNLTLKLDSYIKNIESERDFYKKEVDTLNELLKSFNRSSKNLTVHKSRKENESKLRRSFSHSPILNPNRCTVCHSSIGRNKNSKSPSPNRQQKALLQSPSSIKLDDNELVKVLKERDELKCLLDKFERHMAEVLKKL